MESKKRVELESVRASLVDVAHVLRAESNLDVIAQGAEHSKEVAAARLEQLDAVREDMKLLSRTFEAVKAGSERPADVPSRQEHLHTLTELEQKHINASKQISKAEKDLQELNRRISNLKDDAEIWERRDPLIEHKVEEELVLRAQIWKSMGFELRRGKDPRDDKIMIRTESGDLRLIAAPSDRKPTAEETTELWQINAS